MTYELKTRETGAKVEAFIDAVPDPRRREDARIVAKMMAEVTGDAPAMWGPAIIGFGRYRYVYDSGHAGESCHLGFSPRKANLVFYIAATQDHAAPLLARSTMGILFLWIAGVPCLGCASLLKAKGSK